MQTTDSALSPWERADQSWTSHSRTHHLAEFLPSPIKGEGRTNLLATLLLLSLVLSSTRLPAAEPVALVSYSEHQDLSYYLDAEGARHDIKTPADWEKRRNHILGNMQDVMGPLPDLSKKVPLQLKTLEETKLEKGLIRRKIRYATDADDEVTALLFFPSHRSTEKLPAVLCLHQTVAMGKEEPAGLGGNPNLHYALELAERGYVALAPDYPSFGEHSYDFAPAHGYTSGSMKAIWDNIRALDLLESLDEVDGQRIGCIGHSLGGHNTMFTAAFDPRIKCLASSCGFTRFHKYYEGKLAGWTSARYMPLIASRYDNNPDKVPFDFPEIVAAFAPRPFFTNSPLRDDNFEVSGVRDTIAAARPIYELYGKPDNLQAVYPNSAHDFPADARETAYRFFDQHLKTQQK